MDGVERKKCVSPISLDAFLHDQFDGCYALWQFPLTHSEKKKERKMASDISIPFERLYSYTPPHTYARTQLLMYTAPPPSQLNLRLQHPFSTTPKTTF